MHGAAGESYHPEWWVLFHVIGDENCIQSIYRGYTPRSQSRSNETMPALQYSREDNRLSCAAADREQRLNLLRIASVNRCLLSLVVVRSHDHFHLAIAIQI